MDLFRPVTARKRRQCQLVMYEIAYIYSELMKYMSSNLFLNEPEQNKIGPFIKKTMTYLDDSSMILREYKQIMLFFHHYLHGLHLLHDPTKLQQF